MNKSIIILLISVLPAFCNAQRVFRFLDYRTTPTDTATFSQFKEGYRDMSREEAIKYVDSLRHIYKSANQWEDYHFYTNVITDLYIIQRNFSKTAGIIQETMPLLKKNVDTLSGEFLYTIDQLFYAFYFLNRAEEYNQVGLEIYQLAKSRPQLDSMTVHILTGTVSSLPASARFTEAYDALSLIRNKAIEENWTFYIQNISLFFGFTALMEGKKDAATVFYEEAVFQNPLSKYIDSTLYVFGLEGMLYLYVRKGMYDEAIEYSKLGLEIIEKLLKSQRFPAYDNCFTNFNANLYKSYLALGKEEEAIEIFDMIVDFEWEKQNFPKLIQLFLEYAVLNLKLGNPDVAYEKYLKAKHVSDSVSYENIKYVADTYYGLSKSSYMLSRYNEAAEYAQEGLLFLANSDEHSGILDIPEPDFSQNTKESFNLFLSKLLALYKLFPEHPDESLTHSITEHFAEFEKQTHNVLSGSQDARFIADIQMQYRAALDGLVDFYAENQDSPHIAGNMEYLVKAVINGKATLLRQKILEQTFLEAYLSDEKLFKQHNEIKRKIFITNNRRTIASRSNDKELEKSLTQELASLYAEGLYLESILKSYRDDYNELVTLSTVDDIKMLQKELDKNEALLEYHSTDNALFSMCITNDSYNLNLILLNNFESYITPVMRALRTGVVDINTSDLYKYLIEPHHKMLQGKSHLVIIPDESFSQLPFEIFSADGKTLLVNDFSITYNYSSSLWHMNKQNYPSRDVFKNMLAVAPVFGLSNDEGIAMESNFRSMFAGDSLAFRANSLVGLPQSAEEIMTLKDLVEENWGINVEMLMNMDASKSNFMESLPHQDIIHIATHGLLDRANPMVSGIALSPHADVIGAEDVFFHYELYNLELNADLVVLSACNSGVGSIEAGEGLMALPRGFIFAGVPNVVATLWKVHDEKTKEFMVAFYTHLIKGNSYAEALRLAKIDCIQKGYMPLDWAGFVLIGN